MIDAKRIAEYRHRATLGSWTTIDSAELLQLVECYEAARAYADLRWPSCYPGLVPIVEAEKYYADQRVALDRLRALFPEAGNG